MASIKYFLSFLVLLIFFSTSTAKNYRDIIKERHCDATVKVHCADEIVATIFSAGFVSNECCKQLIRNGLVCHEALLERLVDTVPKYKLNDPQEILIKSVLVWYQCLDAVGRAS